MQGPFHRSPRAMSLVNPVLVGFGYRTSNTRCYHICYPVFDALVTMQAQKEAPHDMQCKDKFLLQSVIAEHGAATTDITAEMVATYLQFIRIYLLLNLFCTTVS